MNGSTPGNWPVVLRIAAGASWLAAGLAKVTDPAYATAIAAPTLARWATLGHGPISSFIGTTLIPNVGVTTFALKAAELLVGVALVLGFLTRLAAFGGLLILVAAWTLQLGFASLAGYGLGIFLEIIAMLYLVVASSGHALAIDAFRNRRPQAPPPALVMPVPVATPVRTDAPQ